MMIIVEASWSARNLDTLEN